MPKGKAYGSPAVREALVAPTREGQVEALIRVLLGDDLPAALEATDVLATLGPEVVPRLVSEMRRSRNNWLIGGTLVKMGSAAVTPLVELLEDADEATAVDCIYLLGEIQDRRALPTLVRSLEDRREKVRMYTVTALLQVGGTRAVAAILSRLTREDKGLEGFIVECLIRHGRKTVEPVLQSLRADDPRVRREAAYLLGRLGDARGAEPLVAALGDPVPAVRANAAYALGLLAPALTDSEASVAALVAALSDPVADVVGNARDALIRYGPAAVDPLVGLCRAGGAAQRVTAALNALREIGSREAEEAMIELLGHGDRTVRMAAVAGLISVGTGRSVEPLLYALRDEDMRWFATLALERVGAENPEMFFTARPNDPTMTIRTQILVRLGPAVVPSLLDLLRTGSTAKQAAVLWILGEIGDPTAAVAVAGWLDDPDLGWLAGRSLHRMGEAGLEELLRYLAGARSDAGAVRAVEALARYETPAAWDALTAAVGEPLPRAARVRSAVLISLRGSADHVYRLRAYLDGEGRHLWPEVEAALRAEGQVR